MNKITCPYCGYKLPLFIDSNTNINNLSLTCKGRNCKRPFLVLVRRGIQKNQYPSIDTIEAFKVVFGKDYKERILTNFGVYLKD